VGTASAFSKIGVFSNSQRMAPERLGAAAVDAHARIANGFREIAFTWMKVTTPTGTCSIAAVGMPLHARHEVVDHSCFTGGSPSKST
jgi:hypothetical protein